ncbi:MAG: PfkB family carbohydrate kinase [archaeon]
MDELKDIIMKMKGLKIAVIGDAVLDRDINCKRERLNPDKKRVPLLRVSMTDKKNSKNIPGQGANVASNIAPFSDCDFYGIVGEDFEGREIERTLKEKRINPKIIFSQEIKTIVKNRFYDDEGEYSFRLDEEEGKPIEISNNLQERLLEILRMEIKNYNAIVLSDYNKGFFVSNSNGESLSKKIISLANQFNVPVIADLKPGNFENFKNCTIICPNRKEAGGMLGLGIPEIKDLLRIGKEIQEKMNPKYVIITCDREGVFIYDNGNSKMLETYAREVSDHTGAGDSLTAGVSLGFACGMNIYNSARFGNMIAGLVVEKMGTATTNPKEVLERYGNSSI